MVASIPVPEGGKNGHRGRNVSIPFIAGQWSLRISPPHVRVGAGAFQSPSLRGSGRFGGTPSSTASNWRSFQSPSLRGSGRFAEIARAEAEALEFQSPSLRGSGRFGTLACIAQSGAQVSIPFIAGQWSLPGRSERAERRRRVSIPFIAGQWSLRARSFAASPTPKPGFNPLHCGAVVASFERPARRTAGGQVSIPFIAGQWSLPNG